MATTLKVYAKGSDQEEQDWCTLDVVQRNGRFHSNDNRRLHAMKEAQRFIPESTVERTVESTVESTVERTALQERPWKAE